MDNTNDQPNSDAVPQHRSMLAILSGVMLIGFCLLTIAINIASFFDPLGSFAIFLTPFSWLFAWLAYKQYCALFCCKPVMARAYHEAYFIIGGFFVFGIIVNLLEAFSEDFDLLLRNKIGLMVMSGILFFGLFMIIIGGLNRGQTIQRRQLLLSATRQRFLEEESIGNYRLRKLQGVIIMLACTFLLSVFLVYEENRHLYGEHLSYQEFPYKSSFPKDASDFSYRRLPRGRMCCEFTVSEESFRNWIASDSDWEYCELIDGGVRILCPVHSRKYDEEDFLVTDGLYAGDGNDSGTRAVFDRTTNRAYYWTSLSY